MEKPVANQMPLRWKAEKGQPKHRSSNQNLPRNGNHRAISPRLKFISLTTNPVRGLRDEEDQKQIRAHVMKYHINHRAGLKADSTVNATTAPLSEFQSKFKLPNARKRKSRNTSTAKSTHTTSVKRKDTSGLLENSINGESDRNHATKEDGTAKLLWGTQKSNPSLLQTRWREGFNRRELSAYLPIEVTDMIMALLDFYRFNLPWHPFTISPEISSFAYAATSSAMFNALLALVSLRRTFAMNALPSRCFYLHRGEALKLIIEKISKPNCEDRVGDETIGAVAFLMAGDQNTCLDDSVQRNHVSGLKRMVDVRGGLKKLDGKEREVLRNMVIWADLNNAALLDEIPLIYEPPFSTNKSGTFECVSEAFNPLLDPPQSLSDTNLHYRIPPHLRHVFVHFRALRARQVFLHRHFHWGECSELLHHDAATAPVSCPKFSDGLAKIEWEILHLGRAYHGGSDEPSVLDKACRYAGLIFTYLAIRRLPIEAAYYRNFVARLRGCMEVVLSDSASIGPLTLWLLINGWVACKPEKREDYRRWFGGQIAEVCRSMNVTTEQKLREELRSIVWPEDMLFEDQLDKLGRELGMSEDYRVPL